MAQSRLDDDPIIGDGDMFNSDSSSSSDTSLLDNILADVNYLLANMDSDDDTDSSSVTSHAEFDAPDHMTEVFPNEVPNVPSSNASDLDSSRSLSSLGILDNISQTSFQTSYSNEVPNVSSANEANTSRFSNNLPLVSPRSSLGVLESVSQTSFVANTGNEGEAQPATNASSSTSSLGLLDNIEQTTFLPNELQNVPPMHTITQVTHSFCSIPTFTVTESTGILEPVPQSSFNPNYQNELVNLPPRNNATNEFTGHFVNQYSESAYDENGEITSEFIEYRNNIINNLINEGKIRIHSPRNVENEELRRRTVDDFLLSNDDVADFHIGGVPVQWVGLDNPEFTANVDTSTPTVNLETIQLAEVEDWSRRLNALREPAGPISISRLNRMRRDNFNTEDSSSRSNFNQRLHDATHNVPEWTHVDAQGLPPMNSGNTSNEPRHSSDLHRRVAELRKRTNEWSLRWSARPRLDNVDTMFSNPGAVENTETDDNTVVEDSTDPSSSFLQWNVVNFNRVSMLVDAPDATVSSVVANYTNNENSEESDPNRRSSPLPWTNVSIENYFENIRSLDADTVAGHVTDDPMDNMEEDSLNRTIYEDSLNLSSPSSSMEDIPLREEDTDYVSNVNNLPDDLENAMVPSTSLPYFGPLEEPTVVQIFESDTSEENDESSSIDSVDTSDNITAFMRRLVIGSVNGGLDDRRNELSETDSSNHGDDEDEGDDE